MAQKNNKEARRVALLAVRADCLAKMTADGRRVFDQRTTLPILQPTDKGAPTAHSKNAEDHEPGRGVLLHKINGLIDEAHRLRRMAEQQRDIKTALRGADTALKALLLLGRLTGQIDDHRVANVTVNVVATREEGIQTAAELLLDMAGSAELALVINQLQQRFSELETSQELPKSPSVPNAEPPQPLLLAARISEKREEGVDG